MKSTWLSRQSSFHTKKAKLFIPTQHGPAIKQRVHIWSHVIVNQENVSFRVGKLKRFLVHGGTTFQYFDRLHNIFIINSDFPNMVLHAHWLYTHKPMKYPFIRKFGWLAKPDIHSHINNACEKKICRLNKKVYPLWTQLYRRDGILCMQRF